MTDPENPPKPGHRIGQRDFLKFEHVRQDGGEVPPSPKQDAKAFDPFGGRLPTTQEAAEELGRMIRSCYEAQEAVREAENRRDQLNDDVTADLQRLVAATVIKAGTTYPVRGGFVTVFGKEPYLQVFFTKEAK